MKNSNLAEIARLSGTTPSTVSRVLNHCGGIDDATRERVFNAADSVSTAKDDGGRCDLYFIVPEVPNFFWKEKLYSGLLNVDRTLSCKYNIYSGLGGKTVLRYLKEAEEMRAKAVIAVCGQSSDSRAMLEKLSEHSLVILLSEYSDITNTFYIGSDAARDGFLMGKYFAAHSSGRPIILTSSGNSNCNARVRGFSEAAELKDAVKIELPAYGKTFPSKTAALLSSLPASDRYSVYSSDGVLDEIKLAAKKAGIYERCEFFGHDLRCPPEKNQTAVRAAVNQKAETQAKAAVAAAEEYLKYGLFPESKNTYVPSELAVYNE